MASLGFDLRLGGDYPLSVTDSGLCRNSLIKGCVGAFNGVVLSILTYSPVTMAVCGGRDRCSSRTVNVLDESRWLKPPETRNMEILTVARDEAALAATFRTIVDVLSPSLAVLDMDVVNYSTPAIATRRSLQRYWSMFDGSTYNVSVYTRTTHDGEEATCEFLSVRDRPRYPDSYCRQLANFDNAVLGYAANSMGQLAYHMVNFPPPFLTADVIFVPAPETYGRDLVTIMIPQPSIQLVRPIETVASFSHPALQLSRAIIRKGKTRRIGGGTLFIFFKIKEVRYPDPDAKRPQEPPRETIFSATGQSFEVDINFSQKINAVYGNIVPDELLTLASVLSNVINDPAATPLSFEAYLESRRGDMQTRRLTTELILGGSAFSPQQIDKLCKILGTTINRASQGGVGLMGLAELLGFAH